MSIIGGLDVHRAQITFDWVDRDSGEARRGRITPATGPRLRAGWSSCPVMGVPSRSRLHRLAVRGRGAPGGWVGRPPG
jgi:hypothetical protein